MSSWNLPPGCTLADIDALFEEADEDQCLDTEVEDQLTEVEGLSPGEIAEFWMLVVEPDAQGMACFANKHRNASTERIGTLVEITAARCEIAGLGRGYIGLYGVVTDISEHGEVKVHLDAESHARYCEYERSMTS